jgi:hypothetical protein
MTTIPRRYGEGTPLNEWIRNHPDLDSSLGFVASDVDLTWYNHKLALIMMTEHKENMGAVSPSQEATLSVLDQGLSRGLSDPNLTLVSRRLHIPEHVHYCGLHVIVCQNTNPEDGDIYIDGVRVTKEQFLKFLRFEWTPVIQVYNLQRERIITSHTPQDLEAAIIFTKSTIYSKHPESNLLRTIYQEKKKEIERLNLMFQQDEGAA